MHTGLNQSHAAEYERYRKRLRQHWQLYLFLLLPVVYLLVFSYYPMFGLQIAFKKFSPPLGIWKSPWIGFANFRKFFTSYRFETVVGNTLTLSLYALTASFPLAILLALLLNALRSSRYRQVIQTIAYIPHFISTVVLVGLVMQLFNPRIGIFGALYFAIRGENAPDLLGRASVFPHMYVWSGVWQSVGWNSIIYVAALAGVDQELHQAAQVDGASRFQRVLHIDLPSILPTATILLILNTGNLMSVGFEKVFLMQNGLNLRTSEVISTYVYKVGISAGGGDFSYATAIGMFNSVVNLILLSLVNFLSRKLSSTSLF